MSALIGWLPAKYGFCWPPWTRMAERIRIVPTGADAAVIVGAERDLHHVGNPRTTTPRYCVSCFVPSRHSEY